MSALIPALFVMPRKFYLQFYIDYHYFISSTELISFQNLELCYPVKQLTSFWKRILNLLFIFSCRFKHRSHLKVHMTIHTGEHPFACHECNKTFRTNKQRTSHMSYVHNTVRNFACEICGKAFKTLKDLKVYFLFI